MSSIIVLQTLFRSSKKVLGCLPSPQRVVHRSLLEATVRKKDQVFLKEILEVLDTNKQADFEKKTESSGVEEDENQKGENNLVEDEVKEVASNAIG